MVYRSGTSVQTHVGVRQCVILCSMVKTIISLRTGYASLNPRDGKSEVAAIIRVSTKRAAHTRRPFQLSYNRILLHLAAIELPEKDRQKNERDQKHSKHEQNICAWPVHYLEKDA